MNQERDRFITEKVLGECWHEPVPKRTYDWGKVICSKCGKLYWTEDIFNFSTPEGFFKLWNFCKEQEWFQVFLDHYFDDRLINPDVFADAIARYFKWEGE